MPSTPQRNAGQIGRATLSDVAREADVSLATVDRVLNKRPGVHARSIAQVHGAVERLNYRPDPAAARLARPHPHRVSFLLPSGTNAFVEMLREQIAGSDSWMEDHRVSAQTHAVDVFEPQRLARRILSLRGRCDTAVVMALDHPLVQAAIDALVAHGIGVITLVSDVPRSRRHALRGHRQRGGRPHRGHAGGPLPRGRPGQVGVIVGSLSLRDHAERCFGFSQVMAAEYPGLQRAAAVEGKDDPARTQPSTAHCSPRTRSWSASTAWAPATAASPRPCARQGARTTIVFVGHELTPAARARPARRHDGRGHQPGRGPRECARPCAWRSRASRASRCVSDQERIRIDIYLKDNLP
jgi:LacI family transcriptional regulator